MMLYERIEKKNDIPYEDFRIVMCTKKRTESDTPGHSKKNHEEEKKTRRQTYPTDQEKERERVKQKKEQYCVILKKKQ